MLKVFEDHLKLKIVLINIFILIHALINIIHLG